MLRPGYGHAYDKKAQELVVPGKNEITKLTSITSELDITLRRWEGS
jgi:hypothetical protein